jgi:DnaJ-class molecular chaperone
MTDLSGFIERVLPPKDKRCDSCAGFGDVAEGRMRCTTCGGSGIKVVISQAVLEKMQKLAADIERLNDIGIRQK